MKKIFLIVSVILFIYNSNAQDNPFVGTWEWEDGNNIFRVELYLDEDGDIRGDFEMVEVLGNNQEVLIYESNIDNGHGFKFGPVIFGDSNGVELGAAFTDSTLNEHPYGPLTGGLIMVIQNSNSPTNQITATWKLELDTGLRFEDDDRTFNVPTDIVLTKVD